KVLLFMRRKPEAEARVVVIHDIGQCCETTIMIEAALLMRPKSRQRRGAVAVGRGAIALKSVNANFRCRVQIVSGLGAKRSHMADCALGFSFEDSFAVACKRGV